MTVIDWQSTLAQLDAAPNIDTPAGQSVLKDLLNAGHAYDSAGKPDVLHESSQHRQWASRKPSERIGQVEPAFYIPQYYALGAPARPGGRSVGDGLLKIEQLPQDARAAVSGITARFDAGLLPKGPEIVRNIRLYYTAAAREAAEKTSRAPTNGQIETALVVAVDAAEAWLAA